MSHQRLLTSTTTILLRSSRSSSLATLAARRLFASLAESPSSSSSASNSRVTTTLKKGGIAHVELSRPDKLNALDMPMFEAIAETAERLGQDKSVRAVVVSGQGRAFCTGLDVKSIAKNNPLKSAQKLLTQRHPDDPACISNLAQDVAYLWREVKAPVIAAVHGMCFGGGLQIALGADMRFCTPDCKLSIMEAKWGMIPDMSASVTLRELIPIDVAKELTMTGRILSGEEAAALNLVTRVVEDPLAEANKVAQEIVDRNPDAVAASKQLYQMNWLNPSEEDCLRNEMELQKTLLGSWNQMAAAVDNFGVKVPYVSRKEGRK